MRLAMFNTPRSTSYKAPSTPNQTLRELKNGKIPINHIIHIRGLTRDEAEEAIQPLFHKRQKQTLYCIIHGKGLGSHNQTPVLKTWLLDILYNHPSVLAYCPATPKDGGTGATYVLISSR